MGRSVRIALRLMTALGQIAAPALAAQVVVFQSAHGQTPQQPSLPPPPYASALARPTGYGGAQGYDRYGGGGVHGRVPAPGAPSVTVYGGPRLAWAGKADMVQPQRPRPFAARYAAQPQPSAQDPVQDPASAQAQAQAVALPPPPQGWSYIPPIGARPTEPPPPPSSIYDAPPPVRQVASAAPPRNGGVRHYSLHSDFGVQPDPIPPPARSIAAGAEAEALPSSFFGQNPDLTAPETPDPQRKVVVANGKSRNAVQPEGGQ